VPSVVLVFQLRAIDKRRIIRKLGELSQDDIARVDAEIWRMLRPPTPAQSENEDGED
jgi:mRNA interferase MazF